MNCFFVIKGASFAVILMQKNGSMSLSQCREICQSLQGEGFPLCTVKQNLLLQHKIYNQNFSFRWICSSLSYFSKSVPSKLVLKQYLAQISIFFCTLTQVSPEMNPNDISGLLTSTGSIQYFINIILDVYMVFGHGCYNGMNTMSLWSRKEECCRENKEFVKLLPAEFVFLRQIQRL